MVFDDDGIGSVVGIQVWRIEKLEPVEWPKKDYGRFFSGDSYLVLHTLEPRKKYNLYLWLGKNSTQDERGACAIMAVNLDQKLNDVPLQFREVQYKESLEFIALWKAFGGIIFLEGGIESAFNHVIAEKYVSKLFHIKGKRHCVVKEVKCERDSLNQGDAFILDAGLDIFLWDGEEANKYEAHKGMEVMEKLVSERGNARGIFVNEASDSDRKKFWTKLGGEGPIKNAVGGDDLDSRKMSKDLKLWSLEGDHFSLLKDAEAPFDRDVLKSTKTYLLDTGSEIQGIYLWVGAECPLDTKKKVMILAQDWLIEKKSEVPVCRLHEGSESCIFKSMFRCFDPPLKALTFSDMIHEQGGDKENMKPKSISVKEVAKLHRASVQNEVNNFSARSAEDIEMTMWRVENFEPVEWPKSKYGQLYQGDSFIIEYIYKPNGKVSEIILYYWQGKNSSIDEKGASAYLVTKLDEERHHGRATQVRVVQGKEPQHFFGMFNGELIIHKGGVASGFHHVDGHASPSNASAAHLYRIQGFRKDNCVAQEVEMTASSLNSNDAFVVFSPNYSAVWLGRGASQLEREIGIELVERLGVSGGKKSSNLLVLEEFEEDEQFWQVLGGKQIYASSENLCDRHYDPMLFHVSNASGSLRCLEIRQFTQEDLLDEDVMLLDTYSAIYIWVGSTANEKEKKAASQIARQYIDTSVDGRSHEIPIIVVQAGHEPLLFTCHFVSWDHNKKPFKDFYEEKKKRMRELLAEKKKSEESQDIVAPVQQAEISFLDPARHKFKYEDLVKKKTDGVDCKRKEEYLSDIEFEEVFRISRKEFLALKGWRQTKLKHDKNLF